MAEGKESGEGQQPLPPWSSLISLPKRKEAKRKCYHYFVTDEGGNYVDCGPVSENPYPHSEAMVGELYFEVEGHRIFKIDRPNSFLLIIFAVVRIEDGLVWVVDNKIPDQLKQEENLELVLTPPLVLETPTERGGVNPNELIDGTATELWKQIEGHSTASGIDPRTVAKLSKYISNPRKGSFTDVNVADED